MKSSRVWVLYTVIRLGIFAVVLAALLLLQVNPWVAAVAAAVIGLCVSYIFFRGPRDQLAQDLYRRRHDEQRDADNDIENAALDELDADATDGRT